MTTPVSPTLQNAIAAAIGAAAQAATKALAAAASATAAAQAAANAANSNTAIGGTAAAVSASLALAQSIQADVSQKATLIAGLNAVITAQAATFNSIQSAASAAVSSTASSVATSAASAATATTQAGIATTQAGTATTQATAAAASATAAAASAATLAGAISLQGTWNASTNTPALVSGTGTKGFFYVVSVAGTTTLDGISSWNASDWALYDGTVWRKIDGLAIEVVSVAGLNGVITAAALKTALAIAVADVSGAAALASPTFTGTPAAPTAAVNTNTTQLASTAFVLAQAASVTPLVDGTATVGTSTRFARGDHVHPTDTTRATARTFVNNTSASSPVTAVANSVHFNDTSGGAITINLPSSPSTGDEVNVERHGANSVSVVGTGANSMGGTDTTFVIDVDLRTIMFRYNGTFWSYS